MTSTPLVSAIIPTYNDAEYLCEAIESVMTQTYQNCEIIVVDDGSTTDPKPLLRKYMDRIQYIYKENGGVGSARNVGIHKAGGEYLAFLDSDDLWLPRKLETQVERFQDDPDLGVVFTDQCTFDEKGIRSRTKKEMCNVYEGMVFKELFSCNFVGISTVMIKRECVDRTGLFDETGKISTIEDINYFLRLARYFLFGYVDEVLVKYRLHGDNMSTDFEKMYRQDFINFGKIIVLFDDLDLGNADYVKKGESACHFEFGLCYFQRNLRRRARKQFVEAISSYPRQFRAWLYVPATFLPVSLIRLTRRIRSVISSFDKKPGEESGAF